MTVVTHDLLSHLCEKSAVYSVCLAGKGLALWLCLFSSAEHRLRVLQSAWTEVLPPAVEKRPLRAASTQLHVDSLQTTASFECKKVPRWGLKPISLQRPDVEQLSFCFWAISVFCEIPICFFFFLAHLKYCYLCFSYWFIGILCVSKMRVCCLAQCLKHGAI